MTKLEYVSWNPNGNIDAYGRNLTIGRGVTTGTARELYGTDQTGSSTTVIDQVLKVESGTYSYFRHFKSSGTNRIRKQIVVFGCDYDRAKSDNAKLTITGQLIGATGGGAGNESGNHDANLFTNKTYMKSGTFMTGVTIAGAEWDHSYYLGINNASGATGKRLFEMEGGYLANSIAGGMDINKEGKSNDQYINVFIRIRGGHVLGSIYGGARYAESQGSRQIVLTGGEVNGWIAGGANGNETTQGGTEGASYIYVGGNAKVDSKGDGTSIGSSIGGCIYGAGCGYGPNSSSGEMGLGTNVVVADNAYVERGVYGGGAFGYCATDKTANIYITGGHVEGKSGNYKDRAGNTTNGIIGGVFGGARMRYGGWANIYMTGGWVETGVYGGSNFTGTLEHDVKMVITGGKVGTDATHTGNIHGGGYGATTEVSGNVDVTIGKTVGEKGPDVFGNVFGGAALGTVAGSSTVTVNAGTCTGAIYGGGLGEQGNNTRGVVSGDITVTVNGTDPKPASRDYAIETVFGGGSYAPANCVPEVTVHNCDNSIGEVYGGGNAATVLGTNVTVYGANKIGSIFGGCNKADVTEAGTAVAIYGGIIDNVFGGNNHSGDITGSIEVSIDYQAEGEGDPCQMEIGNVYGGGNEASYTDEDDDGDYPIVRIYNGSIMHDVFGGGLGEDARVTGNPQVEMTGGQVGGTLYGGGSAAPVTGNPHVKMDVSIHKGSGEAKSENWWDVKGYVFGGGLGESAVVTGNTKVEVLGTSRVGKNVYGGGNGGAVTGNTDVTIGQ